MRFAKVLLIPCQKQDEHFFTKRFHSCFKSEKCQYINFSFLSLENMKNKVFFFLNTERQVTQPLCPHDERQAFSHK